jgi:hypothetical protein
MSGRREPRHLASGSHRSRERDHRHRGMGDDFSSDIATTRKHMQQIRR